MQGTAIDPALLTDVGRQPLKRAIRNERIMFASAVGGFFLSTGCFSYFKASGLILNGQTFISSSLPASC